MNIEYWNDKLKFILKLILKSFYCVKLLLNYQGIVHAKTGTLGTVSNLSGYVIHDQFPTIIFSVMNNDSPFGAEDIEDATDDIVVLLARLKQC